MAAPAVTALEATLKRDRAIALAGLAGISLLAWLYTARLARVMMGVSDGAGMALPRILPWGLADLLLTFAMWAVMMAAMMVPTAAPVILTFAAVHRKRRADRQIFAPTGAFLLGYLAAWAAYCAAATPAQWGLHSAALLSSPMMQAIPAIGGALLVAAGLFQWTPWKQACLKHCRSPLGFLMTEWRAGVRGAFSMGLRHGVFCLGCCWALMALLFVAGVMNLLWMAVITAFVLVEKVAPRGDLVGRVAGVVMVVAGLVLLARS